MRTEHPSNSSATTRGRYSDNFGFVRKLTLTLVSIFVLLMAIISIAWFVMHMHDPAFRVMSLSFSNFTDSGTQLRGKCQVELTIRNPNKKIEVVLDHFNVMVSYSPVGLSVAAVRPVYLEKMANKPVKVDLVVRDSLKLVHKAVPEDLVKEWKKRVVNFDVRMVVRARFEAGILPSREKFLEVFCGDLDLAFFSPKDTRKLLGMGKDCHVKIKG